MNNSELIAAQIMSRGVFAISMFMPLSEVFGKFQVCKASSFPVVDEQRKLVGIISHADLMPLLNADSDEDEFLFTNQRAISQTSNRKSDASDYPIRLTGRVCDVMKSSSFSFRETQNIGEVTALMKNSRVQRVFVTNEQGQPVGVISALDIVKCLAQGKLKPLERSLGHREYESILVEELMEREVRCVHDSLFVKDLIHFFSSFRISGMPVTNHSHAMLGIISQGDIIRAFHPSTESRITLNSRVSDLMSSSIIAFSKSSGVAEAASLMAEKDIHSLLVTNEKGVLEGVLSAFDLVHLLA